MTSPQSRPAGEFVPATSIIIPTGRQRQEFDPESLMELGNDIWAHGLYHAIQVRQDGVTLVTGERRLRSILSKARLYGWHFTYGGELVPEGCVPVIRVSSDDPLALEEIELAENAVRKDLTWQERADTEARLHALRIKQKEVAARAAYAAGADPVDVTKTLIHTYAHTALETRPSADPVAATRAVKESVILARHMHDPDVAGAKSAKEAMKVIQKKDTARQMSALATSVGKNFSADKHKLYNENCLVQMGKWLEVPDYGPRFDVILTDPPYGMGAHEFGDGAGRLANIEHHYDDSEESWRELMTQWAPLSFAVAKPEAHAYVFCDFDRFHELKLMMQDAGWYVFRTPLINVKRNSGRVPLPDQGPRRQYEICLYAIKGKKKVNSIQSDVIVTDSDEQMSHGAQKPVSLYEDLLRRSVKPGDEVLDSFGGTGTLIPAAHGLKCFATVIEQNPTYYGICLERITALPRTQTELPV